MLIIVSAVAAIALVLAILLLIILARRWPGRAWRRP